MASFDTAQAFQITSHDGSSTYDIPSTWKREQGINHTTLYGLISGYPFPLDVNCTLLSPDFVQGSPFFIIVHMSVSSKLSPLLDFRILSFTVQIANALEANSTEPFEMEAPLVKWAPDNIYYPNDTFPSFLGLAIPCEWEGMDNIVLQDTGQIKLTISAAVFGSNLTVQGFTDYNETITIPSTITILPYSQVSTSTPTLEPTQTPISKESGMTLNIGLTIFGMSFLITLIVFLFLSVLPYLRNKLDNKFWKITLDDFGKNTLIGGVEIFGITGVFILAYQLYTALEILSVFLEVLIGVILGFVALFYFLKIKGKLVMFNPLSHKRSGQPDKKTKHKKEQSPNSVKKE